MNEILIKKMTRKEFLVFVGLAMLSISGISQTINRLNKLSSKKLAVNPKRIAGFGNGVYGGIK